MIISKKSIIFCLAVVIFVIGLSGCTKVELFTYEQSKENFKIYIKDIRELLKKNYSAYKAVEVSNNDEIDECANNKYVIKLNSSSSIEIDMQNFSLGETGREDVGIYYTLQLKDLDEKYRNIDVEFFTRIVNCVSGRELSTSDCQDFLEASEEKYSSEKYGNTKNKEMLIDKMKALNFEEDYVIGYELTNKYEECLSFTGLTKQRLFSPSNKMEQKK